MSDIGNFTFSSAVDAFDSPDLPSCVDAVAVDLVCLAQAEADTSPIRHATEMTGDYPSSA